MSDFKPLVLADGTEINASTGEVVREESPTPVEESKLDTVAAPEKLELVGTYKASDLPETGKTMSVIAAVSAFELWGLSTIEIAKALNTGVENVTNLQATEGYVEFKQGMMNNVMRALDDDVRGVIARNAKASVHKIVDTLNGKNKDELPLKAAESLLNRGGFGPKSTVEHNHRMDDELVIRVIRDTSDKHLPTIDLAE